MNFGFSDEQEELRRYVRQWLADRMPLARVRELMMTEDGFDRADWSALAELGWQGMAIPEEYGGAGFGLLELGVLLEEQGRSLFCGPFLSTVVGVAGTILLAGSDSQKSEILPAIASGDIVAALAVTEAGGGDDGEHLRTSALAREGTWVLNGTKRQVIDGLAADLLVIAAQTADGVGLFVVPGDTDGLTRTGLSTLDLTRKHAEISLSEVVVPDTQRLPYGDVATLRRINEVLAAALAMEQVGGAQATLDMAVAYAKERRQFGKPIGSFQAVKHLCADMLIAVESARAAAYYAWWAVAEGNEEAATVVPLAKAHCSDAFVECAGSNIQVHGGIGFTWEHDAHLYFKRAKSSQLMFGTPDEHRRRLAEKLGY